MMGINPSIRQVDLVATVAANGGVYYGLWGPVGGKDRDSDFSEEATYFWKDGKAEKVSGDFPVIPAENYISDTAVAKALDDDFVVRRTRVLGGKDAAQAELLERNFITKEEAEAWIRAGFKINRDAQVFKGVPKPPFVKASAVFKETN